MNRERDVTQAVLDGLVEAIITATGLREDEELSIDLVDIVWPDRALQHVGFVNDTGEDIVGITINEYGYVVIYAYEDLYYGHSGMGDRWFLQESDGCELEQPLARCDLADHTCIDQVVQLVREVCVAAGHPLPPGH